jgi:hypothetical protein
VFIAVTLGDAAFVIDEFFREEAGPMEVEIRGKDVQGEIVDFGGVAAWDVGVAEVLADDRAVLAFDQGVIVGLAGAGLGEFLDPELVEEPRDLVVDVLGAIVGVEGADGEGKGEDQLFQGREQVALADPFGGGDELKLGDLIDGVDEIQALDAIQITLVDAVDAQVARLAFGAWACGARRC